MPRGAIQITLRLSSRGWFSIALRHLCLSIQAIVIVNLYQTQTIAFHTLGMAKTGSRLWKIKPSPWDGLQSMGRYQLA